MKKQAYSVVLIAALLLAAGWFAMEDGFGRGDAPDGQALEREPEQAPEPKREYVKERVQEHMQASHQDGGAGQAEAEAEQQTEAKQQASPVPLAFKSMASGVEKIQPLRSLAKSDIIRTIAYGAYTFVVFSLPEAADSMERWIGLKHDNIVYRIGTIGGEAYESQIEVGSIELFGQSYIRLTGYCGASCAVEHYIEVKDGMPVPLLFLNAHAPARAADWNGDGVNELIYEEGMPLDVVLIQRREGKLVYASVGQALHATQGVSYEDGERRFVLYNGQGERHYRITDEEHPTLVPE
ncbi:hypothetical protein [Paenibacillus curdlanolyticus]|uniref:hypothetical protein n=1 Tax=Paenibacillus curdlanolyticus TaxID=59840 RepID=UPI000593E01F|nr:hypothetical protein [Paenibacillus curdlanolyticus]